MKRPSPTLRLRTEVFLWRNGYVWLLALLLLTAALALWAADQLYFEPKRLNASQQLQSIQEKLNASSDRPTAPAGKPIDTTANAWSELHAVLSAEAQVSTVIRALYTSAQRHQVKVLNADFQRQAMGQTGFIQQTVVMPFQAPYAQVKAFLFDVLRANPSLSLDQITIKREAVAQPSPEIRVKFSIWVATEASPLEGPAVSGVAE